MIPFRARIKWRNAQKGEKQWWKEWIQEHSTNDDDEWLDTVLKYFEIRKNKKFEGKSLVDIGTGPIGILTKLKAKEKIAVEPLMKPFDKTIKWIKAPGEKIPLPDEKADCVFIYNVLQHVMSPEQILLEGTRILKKGGVFYLLEQLNLPVNKLHPNSLKIEMFDAWILKNKFEVIKKTKEDDCYFDNPCAPGTGYSILCLILKKV